MYKRSIKEINYKHEQYVNINGKDLLNLSSNDYLGLSTNKNLIDEFFTTYGNKYNFSSASARLLSGTEEIYTKLEKTLAQLFNKEKALIYNTGYQCNLGVLSALNKKGCVVFSDKLNHASIIDGLRLADGDFYRYRHLDYNHLEVLLQKHRDGYKDAIIVSESVFSMDGDCADIKTLIELKKKYNCKLMIDQAHEFFANDDEDFTPSIYSEVDIITATFGKALASFGAFVVTNEAIIEQLINTSRSFIFSTAIPPINIAWTHWLLTEKKEFLNAQKRKLLKNTLDVHKYLEKLNIETVSETHIIPFIFKETELTVSVCEQLQNLGYFVLPIRPPTVPEGTSRIRASLSAEITIERILPFLEKVTNELKLVK